MEILNKGKIKKPPVTEAEVAFPDKASDAEQHRWFDIQLNRCDNGYNGVAPMHYAYLLLGSIKTVTGSIIRPFWRDGDHKIEWISHEARQPGKNYDEVYVKRREYGLTSRFGGFEPVYHSIFSPGSINLLTSADSFRCKSMFSQKTMVVYENLESRMPKALIPKRQFKNRTGFLQLQRRGTKSDEGSQVELIETADSDLSAKKPEGYRALSIFLDELFLHPRAPIVLASSQASIKQGFVKKGHIVMGGSCGAETEAEAVAMKSNSDMVETMYKDSQSLGIQFTFIPGTLCIDYAPETDKEGKATGRIIPFMENGYSLEDKAKEWVMKERLKLERATDKTRYWTFVKNYPLSIDEVFEVNKMGFLPPEVYNQLDVAKKNLETVNPVEQGFLNQEKDGSIKFQKSNKGYYFIARHPLSAETYIGGIDPIPFSEGKVTEGSDFAIVIKSRENQSYDAYFADRDLDEDRVMDRSIMLQRYYASSKYPLGAPAMLEINMGHVTRRVYKERGLLPTLIAKSPHILGSVYVDNKENYGWRKDGERSGALAIASLITYLKKYAQYIPFLRLIKEVTNFPKANTDVLDAVVSCEVFDKALSEIEKKKTGIGKSFRQVKHLAIEEGKTVVRWRTVEVSGDDTGGDENAHGRPDFLR